MRDDLRLRMLPRDAPWWQAQHWLGLSACVWQLSAPLLVPKAQHTRMCTHKCMRTHPAHPMPHVHTHKHTHAHTHTHAHIHINACAHTLHTQCHTCTYKSTHTHTHTHAHTHKCMHTPYTLNATRAHTHMHTCTHTHHMRPNTRIAHVCMYTQTQMHAHTNTHARIHTSHTAALLPAAWGCHRAAQGTVDCGWVRWSATAS